MMIFFYCAGDDKSIFFTDNEHGWIARDEGDILYTVDGGITWQHMFVNFNGTFGGIFFTDIDHGWVVGDNEAIFQISNGSIVDIEEHKFQITNSKSQINCNPNPTDGIVDFRFSILDFRWVSLKIYDVHGREVAVVLDEKMLAGEHTVQFDASGLPDGIYLLQLTAGEETKTGKIVICK